MYKLISIIIASLTLIISTTTTVVMTTVENRYNDRNKENKENIEYINNEYNNLSENNVENNKEYNIDDLRNNLYIDKSIVEKSLTYNKIEQGEKLSITAVNTYEMKNNGTETISFYIPSNIDNFYTNGITYIAIDSSNNITYEIDIVSLVDNEYYTNFIEKEYENLKSVEYNSDVDINDNVIIVQNDTITAIEKIFFTGKSVVTYKISFLNNEITDNMIKEYEVVMEYLNIDKIIYSRSLFNM